MVGINGLRDFFQPELFCDSRLLSTHLPASPFVPCPDHLPDVRTGTPAVHSVVSSCSETRL